MSEREERGVWKEKERKVELVKRNLKREYEGKEEEESSQGENSGGKREGRNS